MSVVARERLAERVETYVAHNPDAALPEILGRFRLDPDEESDEHTLIKGVLTGENAANATHDTAGVAEGNA